MNSKQILVCNSGSSSLKVDVFAIAADGRSLSLLAGAAAERLNADSSPIKIEAPDSSGELQKTVDEHADCNHARALEIIYAALKERGIFASVEQQFAVGHRIVHGGPYISAPVILDADAIQTVERCAEFAPLHNPANLAGIRGCAELFPQLKQVGVFDTAFHASIPEVGYTYALPRALAEKYHLRRYGFHGTSHEYMAEQLADCERVITLHLGNGASVCAIRDGRSIDTSMGFTPLEGLVMGTRCGDLDPAIVALLMEKENIDTDEVDRLLNKDSGLKGIAGQNDMRDLLAAAPHDAAARLAVDVFCYRARKYVGAYTAALGGVDGLAFSGGIGENAADIRAAILEGLEFAGLKLDPQKNQQPPADGDLAAADSRARIRVVPADEELAIARKTLRLLT